MILFCIALLCILIFCFIYFQRISKTIKQYYDIKTKYTNELTQKEQQLKELRETIKLCERLVEQSNATVEKTKTENEENIQNIIERTEKEKEKILSEHYEALAAVKQQGKEKIKEEEENIAKIIKAYTKQAAEVQEDIFKLSQTRQAAIEAFRKEEEIKQQKAFFSVSIDKADVLDIKKLQSIKPSLSKPRILSMLIWQTYYQKPMTQLCNNVVGEKTTTGIYKITNQKNGLCYIGQAVDISKRWKEHAKCGLDIDAPASNKLYKAMIDDGLESFTFEILEVCEKDMLNQKESFYIDLYNSVNYGYNSQLGVKK